MWSRVLILLFLLGLVAVPAQAAEPVTFEVVGGLPLKADGSATLSATAQPALLARQSGGSFSMALQAERVHLVAVEYWEEVTSGPFSGHSGVRTQEQRLDEVSLDWQDRLEGFTVLAWTASGDARSVVAADAADDPEEAAWMATAPVRVFRLGEPLTVRAPVDRDAVDAGLRDTVFGRPMPFTFEVPNDSLHLQAGEATHHLTGSLQIYITGARLTLHHADGVRDLLATETLETRPGSVYLPDQGWTGPGEHQERIVRYLQLRADTGAMQVMTRDAPAALFAEGFDLELDGHLAVPRASGTIHFQDGDRSVDLERLVVSGAVGATLLPGDDTGTARLSGEGTVTYLRVGADAERFPVGVAAAAGVAVLAAIALACWQHGLFLPLFSRMKRSDVLDHGSRASIYEAVKAEPGVTPHDLVARTGVGWSTVTYHLGVLERNELVVTVRDGRYRRYFDRTSGRYANGRKKVVSALKHETTAAIARCVREEPGLVQRRLAERFDLAASSVHWHVQRLVDAGLVVKERRAQAVALMPGPAWTDLEPQDLDTLAGPALPPVPA